MERTAILCCLIKHRALVLPDDIHETLCFPIHKMEIIVHMSFLVGRGELSRLGLPSIVSAAALWSAPRREENGIEVRGTPWRDFPLPVAAPVSWSQEPPMGLPPRNFSPVLQTH